MLQQERHKLPDTKLILGCIVEDVESDLVAQAAAAEKVLRGDSVENAVEASIELRAHDATSRQRSTYFSSC